eukprot:scaffold33057_cov59-Phaeocystis_antarctica.AAC.2
MRVFPRDFVALLAGCKVRICLGPLEEAAESLPWRCRRLWREEVLLLERLRLVRRRLYERLLDDHLRQVATLDLLVRGADRSKVGNGRALFHVLLGNRSEQAPLLVVEVVGRSAVVGVGVALDIALVLCHRSRYCDWATKLVPTVNFGLQGQRG